MLSLGGEYAGYNETGDPFTTMPSRVNGRVQRTVMGHARISVVLAGNRQSASLVVNLISTLILVYKLKDAFTT
jgi:hypothetical protein